MLMIRTCRRDLVEIVGVLCKHKIEYFSSDSTKQRAGGRLSYVRNKPGE